MKKVRRHPQAEEDLKDAAWHYAGESISAASRFIAESKRTIVRIEKMPGAGSPRFAQDLGIPNLRVRAVGDFPYFMFYVEHRDYIDLMRVLHTHRDIFSIFL